MIGRLLPMALCADAEIRDGGLVGDPTEGALVVLAAKGGVDPTLARERYPRVATLPFDAAYKFMATFHRMEDADGKPVIRAYVKGAPDQLLARASTALGPDGKSYAVDQVRPRTWRRTSVSARRACACWPPPSGISTRPPSTRTRTCSRPSPTSSSSRSSASSTRPLRGARRHRQGALGRHPGPDDHRRPRRHRRGHRPPARDRGPGDHRRRVLGDVRRPGRRRHR